MAKAKRAFVADFDIVAIGIKADRMALTNRNLLLVRKPLIAIQKHTGATMPGRTKPAIFWRGEKAIANMKNQAAIGDHHAARPPITSKINII